MSLGGEKGIKGIERRKEEKGEKKGCERKNGIEKDSFL